MGTVEKVFLPLTERLDSFSEKQKYKSSSYGDIISAIKEEIFDCATKDVLEANNRHLERVATIKNAKEDLSDYCSKYEYIEVENPDDYSLLPPVMVYQSEVALSPQEKVHIHEALSAEFKFYTTELERLKSVFETILKREEEERHKEGEKKQGKKREPKALFYKDYDKKKGLLDGLRALLIANKYITRAETPVKNAKEKRDFRKAFAGEAPPKNKVPWIGTEQALKYFIDRMYEIALLTGSFRWERTKACFEFDGSLKNIGGQKDITDKEKKVLDGILDKFKESLEKKSNPPAF